MLTRADHLKIKGQTKLSIRDCGGQEAAVECSERLSRHQSFSEFGNSAHMDKFIAVDTAIELDRFSGNPRFAKLLAEMAGGIFVPLPKGNAPGRLQISGGQTAKEFGDVMIALGASLQDGKVDAEEARGILSEIREAITAMAGLAEDVKAEVKP